ncbi:MAG: hypothetical protein KA535_05790 [Azonexus sp.]|nr:hypothetical protein [Azonexus sp.]
MSHDDKTLPLALPDPNAEGIEDSRFWIDVGDFSALAGINLRNVRDALKRCYTGGTWRKTSLVVRIVDSVGGNRGKAYQVFVPSLPVELASTWQDQHPALFKTVEAPKVLKNVPMAKRISETTPSRHAAIEKAVFLETLIKPALQHPKHTPGRGEMVRKIVSAMPITFPNGKQWTYNERGISDLIRKYEDGGLNALIRKHRDDLTDARVIVSRTFDQTAPFDEAELQSIWSDLSQHIKNLFLGTHGTMPQIRNFANVRLVELSRAKGWADASLKNCDVGIAQVRKFKDFRKAAAKSLDAGKFADHFKPRIMRGRAGLLPMEIVMGDVHPVDILNKREDGSEATARMVSWLDLATNRVFYTLFLFEKGRSITQAHIAYSFVQMVRAWGLPSILYLDNGSEYVWKEMMDGFEQLSLMVDDFRAFCMNSADLEQRIEQADSEDAELVASLRAVVRATPHNPQGKAPKEGVFGVLERTVFCFIPGWIGGDRMKKKTHKVGKAPRAFDGNFEQFQTAFKKGMNFYHARPQGDGSSPNEKFSRHVAAGWSAVDVDYSVLLMALAERKPYKVLNTGVEIAGVTYWHDVMASPYVMGNQVLVYYAKWDSDQIVILPRDATGKATDPVVAYRNREFGIVDKSGAIESGRRISLMSKGIREMKQGSSAVDTVGEMEKFAQLSPPAAVVPFGPKITLPEEFKGIREAVEQAGEPPAITQIDLLPGQWFDHETGTVRSMYDRQAKAEISEEDDWEAIERARLIRKAEEANALGTEEETDPSGCRLTGLK